MSARATTVIALLCAMGSTAAAAEVHTDPREVHACLPLGDDGRVVAATRGGLALIGADQRATVWTALDGLPGTRVDSLYGDGGRLWVGTEGGLAEVELAGSEMSIVGAYASESVRAIARHGGHVYVATWGDGVKRLARGRLVDVPLPGAAAERARVGDLIVHGGTLYAATAGHGVFALGDGGFAAIDTDLGDTIAWSLYSDGDDLVIGTVDGIFRHSAAGTRRIGNGDIRDIGSIDGDIVAAGFGSGFRRVDERVLRGVNAMPGDELFPQGLGAVDGLACIASHRGLWIRRGTSSWKRAVLDGPPSNDITDAVADGERLIVSTFDQGLAVLDGGTWRELDDELIDPNVNAIDFDGERLWVATSAGLTVIGDDGTVRLTKRDGLPSRHILSVTALRGGGALVGTTRGAALVHDGRAVPVEGERTMMRANVWAVAESADETLWLGTTRGLYRRPAGGEWRRLSTATGELRDDWVTAIALDGPIAYAGTYKGGVTRIDADGSVTQLGDGWVNPNGLTVVGDKLYASTMDGLLVGDGHTAQWTKSVPTPGIDTTSVLATDRGLVVTGRRGMVVL